MQSALQVGDRVRITLHGRRVGGWVIGLGVHGKEGFNSVPLDKLSPVIKRSGVGVLPHLVPLTLDVAKKYCGPRRAVLQSASAPRSNILIGAPQHGKIQQEQDPLSEQFRSFQAKNIGSVVFGSQIDPLHSVLSIVKELATSGPVLVVCPTVRMAVMGAASLRRHGCKVALAPDDWSQAASGVDVVIGPRSAVWAPCVNLSSIVVVDEHDDSLQEERVPTWHARDVAFLRSRIEGAKCVLSSPVLSVEAHHLVNSYGGHVFTSNRNATDGWPPIRIIDINEIEVDRSLASSELIQLIRKPKASVLCVLNTKGRARLLACRSCRTVARCQECSSVERSNEQGELVCDLCSKTRDAVCMQCGRTSFLTLRSGITQLRDELMKAATVPVTEVDASTTIENIADSSGVFIGTEALLHRVPSANVVVFLDFDTEMLSPRITATRDALSLLIRAARIVGKRGQILVQTRHPQHELLRALAMVVDSPEALESFKKHDLALRQMLQLPPFMSLARVSAAHQDALEQLLRTQDIAFARESSGSFLLKTDSEVSLQVLIEQLRDESSQRLRIEMNPSRY